MVHTLPKLSYSYDSLEPYIDTTTMEIHYTKHHATYVDNLNKALEKFPELQELSIDELLSNLSHLNEKTQTPINEMQVTQIKNHGGGHYNHSLFWSVLTSERLKPSDRMLELITRDFGSWEVFVDEFEETSLKRFGSGWSWLVLDQNKNLKILSTPNQDCPLSDDQQPLLCLDLWEHAYYLRYQNRRVEYVKNFWNIVNWYQVEKNYDQNI